MKSQELRKIIRKEVSDALNEAKISTNYVPADFPVGTQVHMDDEVWLVVNPGVRGNKIFLKPHNSVATSRYANIVMEFDIAYLNGNITMLEN